MHNEKCFITNIQEYSIQRTSLEQISNKFGENQSSILKERRSTIVERGVLEKINSGEVKNNLIEKKLF